MHCCRLLYVSLSVLTSLMIVSDLHAFESSTNYRIGTSYTDNSLLVENNKKNELSIDALVGFSVLDNLPNLNYSLISNVRHTNYTNNTLADVTYYTVIADLVWDIVPTSFSWQVNNNLSVREINQLNRPLPNNVQQVNIFSTGPSFVYRVSALNRVLLDYRYSDIKYEKKIIVTNVDSQRDVYTLALEHRISERSNISLNFEDTAVKYLDKTTNSDFTGKSMFLTYDTTKARSIINVSAGVSEATLVTTGKKIKSDFYNAQWDYQINFSSIFSARYWKGLSDPTNDVRLSNFLNSGVVNTAVLNDTSIFTVERMYLIYNQTKSNWKTIYTLYGFEQDYDQLQPTQTTLGASIAFDYNLSRSLVLTNRLSQITRKILSANELRNLDTSLTIGTRYYISTNLQFLTQYQKNDRTSTQTGRSYEENVLSIGLTYTNANLRGRLQ